MSKQEIPCSREHVVQVCSDILQWWRDHRLEFQLSVILQEIRSGLWQLALRVNKRIHLFGWAWFAEDQILRVRQWTTLFFNSALKVKKDVLRLTKRFHILLYRASVGFEINHWINWH